MDNHIKGSKKHITSYERFKILKYLSLGYDVPKIAKLLGFNKTSIYREIIINSIVENRRPVTYQEILRNCKNYSICKAKGMIECPSPCFKYLAKTCSLIKKPFQVCNFCERKKECPFEHLIYHPEIAQDIADSRFKNGKNKIKLPKNKLEEFDNYVSELIINGQSPEVIKSYSSEKEFPVCTKH